MLILAVGSVLTAALVRRGAEGSRQRERLAISIDIELRTLDGLRWKSLAQRQGGADVSKTAEETRVRIERALEKFQRASPGHAPFGDQLHDYVTAIETELQMVDAGRLGDAQAFAEARVNPAFDLISEEIEEEVANEREQAVVATREARLASIVVVASGAVLCAMLFWQFARQRQATERERDQAERLRGLDRMKDSFVAGVSHEMRTPLTSIRGYVELLRGGEAGAVTDEQERFLEIVDRSATRLLGIIADLLFVAQVEAGKLTLELGEVDLTSLAVESSEAARPAADAKGIDLTLHSQPLLPVSGDRARLGQVLDNLLSNAIKFTPAGGRVELRVFETNGEAVLEVSDTGMGISATEQERLFERFFRAAAAGENAIQGTGLGLSISKAIIEGHGGRISCESMEGTGATFRVELPLAGDVSLGSRLTLSTA